MFKSPEGKYISSHLLLKIIVPCYNPITGWEKELAYRFWQLQKELDNTVLSLVVVNDGSAKGVTEENIKYLEETIPDFNWISYEQNQGKGYALRKGIAVAEAEYYIYTDIDFPYTLGSMGRIFEELQNGTDVAVGVRESDYYLDVPLRREIISKSLKKLIKYLLRIPITDTQCGLKGFNNKGREVFLRTTINRFLFDMEFVQMAFNNPALQVKPVTVTPRPDIVFSKMNYKVLIREMFNFMKLANPLRKKR